MTDASDGLNRPRRAVAVAAVLAAMALVVLDAGLANVALPQIAHALGASPAHAVLVVTAYQAALVMALLPCAALGERFGNGRLFGSGVAIFTTASVLCALAPSLPWLVAARVLQGLGGAAVMALGVALLRVSVPRGALGAAIGWNALTVALSSAAGPSLGALILSVADWPWLFLVNLPLGAAALVAASALPSTPRLPRGLDLASMALNAIVFSALILAAEQLRSRPGLAAALFALAAMSLAALVRRELPKAAPLVPLDLLRDRSFRISVIASVCCFTGQAAALVALPFHLQHALGASVLATGLCMTVWPLGVAATSLAAGRLAERGSGAWLCGLGGLLLALGLAGLALWPLHAGLIWRLPLLLLCGVGFGLFQAPNNRSMFLSAPLDRSGAAGGMQGTARLTGQTIGATLMAQLFAAATLQAAPRLGLALAAACALAAGLVSTLRAAPARSIKHV